MVLMCPKALILPGFRAFLILRYSDMKHFLLNFTFLPGKIASCGLRASGMQSKNFLLTPALFITLPKTNISALVNQIELRGTILSRALSKPFQEGDKADEQ